MTNWPFYQDRRIHSHFLLLSNFDSVSPIQSFFTSPKLGILTHACWNGAICFVTVIETDSFRCVSWLALIARYYKIVDNQTLFMFFWGVGIKVGNFVKGEVRAGNVGKVTVGVKHFTSDPTTLISTHKQNILATNVVVSTIAMPMFYTYPLHVTMY